jgi:hypothetical protein
MGEPPYLTLLLGTAASFEDPSESTYVVKPPGPEGDENSRLRNT